jgi:hypothetical protein
MDDWNPRIEKRNALDKKCSESARWSRAPVRPVDSKKRKRSDIGGLLLAALALGMVLAMLAVIASADPLGGIAETVSKAHAMPKGW